MMNRKTTLILSIIGIFTVIVTLIGFTYAYYAAKVNENTTEKSVDIVTVNKSIEFTDLSETETSSSIAPGYENIKIFTVHNTGTGKASYHIYLSEVVNEFIISDDIRYTLYKKSGNNTISDINNFTDCEVISEGYFPKNNTYIKTDEVIENPNEYYTYALKTTYINTVFNQDIDQGKIFSSKVQIHSEIENTFNEGTLAHKIIENALHLSPERITEKHAQLMVPTPTKVAVEANAQDESVLSITNDDDGVSYYYRGNIKNNFLNFNGMCWRIIRIEGDGSIKLLLEDIDELCSSSMNGNWDIGKGNYGYTDTIVTNPSDQTASFTASLIDFLNPQTNSDKSLKTSLYTWFTNSEIDTSKLKEDTWCLGNLTDLYDSTGNLLTDNNTINDLMYNNIKYYYKDRLNVYGEGIDAHASLLCKEDNYVSFTSYYGTLTAAEVALAGAANGIRNYNNFINNVYQASNGAWWTLSASAYYNTATPPTSGAFHMSSGGYITSALVNVDDYHRPAITLKTNTLVATDSGNGTADSPYKIQ